MSPPKIYRLKIYLKVSAIFPSFLLIIRLPEANHLLLINIHNDYMLADNQLLLYMLKYVCGVVDGTFIHQYRYTIKSGTSICGSTKKGIQSMWWQWQVQIWNLITSVQNGLGTWMMRESLNNAFENGCRPFQVAVIFGDHLSK